MPTADASGEFPQATASKTKPTVSTDVTPLWGVWELWASGGSSNSAPSSSSPGPAAKASSWLDSVKSLAVVDTAEGMWGVLNCLSPPSNLPKAAPGTSYYFFRLNIAPLWEHEANRRGGKWVVSIPMKDEGAAVGDAIWEKVCASLCSEWFASTTGKFSEDKIETEMCGCSVSLRGNLEMRISLWTRSASDEAAQREIGFKFLELCKSCFPGGDASLLRPTEGGSTVAYIQHRPAASRVMYTL